MNEYIFVCFIHIYIIVLMCFKNICLYIIFLFLCIWGSNDKGLSHICTQASMGILKARLLGNL